MFPFLGGATIEWASRTKDRHCRHCVFFTGGVKNLVTGGHGNGGLKMAFPTREFI